MSKVGEEWGFFGGEIQEDETPEEAIIRETKEELDFDLKEYKYIGEISFQADDLKKKYPGFKFDVIKCKIFISLLKDIENFKQKEGQNMKFFSIKEAKNLKMVSKGDIKILDILNQNL